MKKFWLVFGGGEMMGMNAFVAGVLSVLVLREDVTLRPAGMIEAVAFCVVSF